MFVSIRRPFASRLCVSVALVLATVGGAGCAPSPPARVRVGHGLSAPMGGYDEAGRPRGFVVDALNAAAARVGVELSWVLVDDMAASDDALRHGTVDVAVGVATDERRRAFVVTEPWWSVELSGLALDERGIRDEAGFRGVRIAYPEGLGAEVPRAFAPSGLVVAPNASGVARALCDGQADAAILGTMYLRELLFANSGVCSGSRMRLIDLSVSVDYTLVSTREAEPATRALRRAIDAITADGTLTAIAARHPPVSTPHAAQLAELLTARYARRTSDLATFLASAGAVAAVLVVGVLVRSRRRLAAVNARLEADIRARLALERDHQRLQGELQQAQKMESIGRLAGGVAHDFNNLLTVQLGYCDTLRRGLRPGDPMADGLGEIARCAERAAGLTSQLLAFSRRQTLQPVVFELNDRVLGLMKMLHRLLGEDLDVVFSADPEPVYVCADPGQIDQVLINLAVNARDAMPDGGRLVIRVDASPEPPSADAYCLGERPDPAVAMSVRDSGTGMDADTLHQVFEPFFTTKALGKGTGLGLSTVYGIVTQSGGTLAVASAPGVGSTFTVYLPRASARADEPPATPEASAGGHGEVVLLVEDEPSLRRLVALALQGLGYDVHQAASGTEALELVARQPLRPDVLVTDVIMPQLGGRPLAEQLRAADPDLRVVFMSGYTDNSLTAASLLAPGTRFLQKPFSLAALGETIRDVLAERGPSPS